MRKFQFNTSITLQISGVLIAIVAMILLFLAIGGCTPVPQADTYQGKEPPFICLDCTGPEDCSCKEGHCACIKCQSQEQ